MIPPEQDAEFVYHKEDVLGVYHEPYDTDRPVICFDEHPKQLIAEVREPESAEPGKLATQDYQYEQEGTQNLYLAFGPLTGWRTVTVKERRTKEDWVTFMKEVDEQYPDADCISVVLDNLTTHKPAAFYEYFEPTEARRILEKLEFHFTPVHGSWLNMAEIEFNALEKQCLDRRIPNKETLRQEVSACVERRNATESDVTWQFTSEDAQVKLHNLYPCFDD